MPPVCARTTPHTVKYRSVPFTFSRICRPVIFVRLYSVCARSSPTTATGSAFAHCHAFGSVPASISICMTSPSRSSAPRSTACSVVCPTRTVPLCALIGISVRMPSTSCSISSASAAESIVPACPLSVYTDKPLTPSVCKPTSTCFRPYRPMERISSSAPLPTATESAQSAVRSGLSRRLCAASDRISRSLMSVPPPDHRQSIHRAATE